MPSFKKSPVVARELGVSYASLYALIRRGKIPAPKKDTSNHYVWTLHDVKAAKIALKGAK